METKSSGCCWLNKTTHSSSKWQFLSFWSCTLLYCAYCRPVEMCEELVSCLNNYYSCPHNNGFSSDLRSALSWWYSLRIYLRWNCSNTPYKNCRSKFFPRENLSYSYQDCWVGKTLKLFLIFSSPPPHPTSKLYSKSREKSLGRNIFHRTPPPWVPSRRISCQEFLYSRLNSQIIPVISGTLYSRLDWSLVSL